MRRTAMAVLAATTMAMLLVAAAEPAMACSCSGDFPDKAAMREATAVFVGTAVAPDPPPGEEHDDYDPVTWRFEVDQVFKGDVGVEQEVVTILASEACGSSFPLGPSILVFASDDRRPWNVELDLEPGQVGHWSCGATRAVDGPLTEVAGVEPHPPVEMLAGPEGDTVVAASDDGLFLPAGVLIALGVTAVVLGIGALVWGRRTATRS